MTVLVADTKHDTIVYGTALACLKDRLTYNWFDAETQERAEKIVADGDEKAADAFLGERSDYEYEYVEWKEVR